METNSYKSMRLETAQRPLPPNDDWRIVWGCQEYDAVLDAEITKNRANFSTKRVGESFMVPDPQGNGPYHFVVEELTKRTGETVQVANCELTPGVWASAIRDK